MQGVSRKYGIAGGDLVGQRQDVRGSLSGLASKATTNGEWSSVPDSLQGRHLFRLIRVS